MTITEHKRLTAATPEDLVYGEKIEVSDSGKKWFGVKFSEYGSDHRIIDDAGLRWMYARRPAAYAPKRKRLSDEAWSSDRGKYRFVQPNGRAYECEVFPILENDGWTTHGKWCSGLGGGYDTTDWQNSLERRP